MSEQRSAVVAARCSLIAIFLLLASCYLLVAGSFAVEVEPQRLELSIPADRVSQGKMKVTNPSAKTVNVRIQTGPYRFLESKPMLPSAQEWLSFEPDSFTLAPGADADVAIRIHPPSNVQQDSAGEYVAAIVVDELPAEEDKPGPEFQARITVVPRFAMPAYFFIEGREMVEVRISDFSVKEAEVPLSEKSPQLLRLEAVLKNTGLIHVRPTGTLTLLHQEGGLYRALPLGKSLPLLPGGTAGMPALLPMPPPGRYRAIATIEAGSGRALEKELAFEITAAGRVIPSKPVATARD